MMWCKLAHGFALFYKIFMESTASKNSAKTKQVLFDTDVLAAATQSFEEAGLSEISARGAALAGFEKPTGIQTKVIPAVAMGHDIVACSETGSGKTAACGIPLVQKIDTGINAVQVLILTPTRELALQYLDEVSSIGTPYGIKPFVVYGGFSKDIHLAKLKDGVHLLVATPGRLIDIIYNNYFSLEHLKTLVIDEADEMLKMGFLEDVDFIKSCIVQKHQTLLFSATMPAPIKRLAEKYLKDAVHIRLNQERVVPKNLSHCFISVGRRHKEKALTELLSKEHIRQAIIFCNTRTRVKSVFKNVRQSIHGIDYLHGGLDQNVRTRILEKFRDKKIKYLVTTDVMARGIDISGVSHIINYDLHKNLDIYIHRTGRTARLGKEGTAISLITPEDRPLFEEIKANAGITAVRFKPDVYKYSSSPAGREFRDGRKTRGFSSRRNSGKR